MYILKTPCFFSHGSPEDIIEAGILHNAVNIIGGPTLIRDRDTILHYWKNKECSVIVHAINRFYPHIQDYCDFLNAVECSAYIVPPTGGTTQGLHTDRESVVLHGAFGTKTYRLFRDDKELTFKTDTGYGIFFKNGEPHEAIITGPSTVLSFVIYNDLYLPTDARLDGKKKGSF
jgi:hypothetical protein